MRRITTGTVFATGLAGVLLLEWASTHGAGWPMLGRDSTRNGVSPEKGAPTRWQSEERKNGFLVQPAWNVLWEAQLGSANFASPTVAGGLVWVGTNNARPRDPRVKGDAAVLMCFRERDGRFLWQYVSPRLGDHRQDWPGSAINCAPLAEGDRLYFTTNRCEVVCLDVGPLRKGTGDPRLLWKLDMRQQLGVYPARALMTIGRTCSIGASYRGRLYVTTGNSADASLFVPAPNAPSLLCLDRDSGKVLWQDSSPGKDIHRVQWSSPLVVEVGGHGQVIVAQGDGWLRSFDALPGKLIWKFDTNPKAATWNLSGERPRNSLLATPVFWQGHVYISNGYEPEYGGFRRPGRLYCIDPARKGDISPELPAGPGKGRPNPNSGALWCFGPGKEDEEEEEGMHATISAVAVQDGLVIAPDLSGCVHCLDARTGRKQWTYEARGNIYGSPLVVDGKVYVGDNSGQLSVLALAREKRQLAGNLLGARFWNRIRSSPVFANGVLYVVAGWKLYAIKAVQEGPALPSSQVVPAPAGTPSRPARRRGLHDVFVPTPQDVVERMLQTAQVKQGDLVYDLGCGDGRIVVTAARKYRCRAAGYDLDPECVRLARQNVARHGVGRLVTIEQKDFFGLDLGQADVITLYLLPSTTERLLPQLRKLKPGARVVSHAFTISGIPPDRVVRCRSQEDGLEHTIYLWTAPLSKAGSKK